MKRGKATEAEAAVVTYRRISNEELQNACERIDPNSEKLASDCKRLIDRGYTVAMALVKIADEQAALRKPVGLAAARNENELKSKKHSKAK